MGASMFLSVITNLLDWSEGTSLRNIVAFTCTTTGLPEGRSRQCESAEG